MIKRKKRKVQRERECKCELGGFNGKQPNSEFVKTRDRQADSANSGNKSHNRIYLDAGCEKSPLKESKHED